MAQTQVQDVSGPDGLRGTVDFSAARADAGRVTVQFETGESVMVPVDLLQHRPDGSLWLPIRRDEIENIRASRRLRSGEEAVVPVVEESLRLTKRQHETGSVVVHVTPHERVEFVDVPLAEERVDVQRVEVNRFVKAPPPVRQEGNVTIVPVMEEVLVVEKRLMVREELRITRRREVRHEPQRVTLRHEEARVLRSVDKPH